MKWQGLKSPAILLSTIQVSLEQSAFNLSYQDIRLIAQDMPDASAKG
jgi:hypothetical protein